jgi:Holliday junction resolvase-like predicted endonuclease
MKPEHGPSSGCASGTGRHRTRAQDIGDAAEAAAEAFLVAAGWEILARRIRVGRAELDLVAIDPGPPRSIVVVEVRWRSSRSYGLPEETIDGRKVGRLWGALARLLEAGCLPDGRPLPRLPARVDVIAGEPAASALGRPQLRHHLAVGAMGAGRTLW